MPQLRVRERQAPIGLERSQAAGIRTLADHVEDNVIRLALYRGDAGIFGEPGWLGWWTVFFWGWFLGYGPLMAMFIARVSRGRSIRAIVIMLSIIAPIATNFWFTIVNHRMMTNRARPIAQA